MSSTKLKPLYLMDIFQELTDEEHRLTVPELIELLAQKGIKAERKGLYRDIDALIEYGADIRKTGTGYYLGRRRFTSGELKVLSSAVQAAGFISERRTQELTSKIASMAGAHQAKHLKNGNIGGVKCKNDEVLNIIDIVDRAITARRQITFLYIKRDASKREIPQRSGERYRVSPYALIWMQDRYYMVCNMEGRNDITHFRLDRMRSVRSDMAPWRHFGEVSEYKTEFKVSEYAAHCMNMYGGEAERIRIRCDTSLASEVLDRFGEDTIMQKESAEKFVALIEAAGDGFLSWAAQFGAKLEIVYPESLREKMRIRLEEAAALYK